MTPVLAPSSHLVNVVNNYINNTFISPTAGPSPPDNSTASQSSGNWWQGPSWNAAYAALMALTVLLALLVPAFGVWR